MAEQNRRELGDFLRARRARLSPESVGLSGQRRRRTPGLRREEVAELAGIGVDWYIRLEQGRPVTPSVSTVDALARALRLTEMEHQHLRALAGGGGLRVRQGLDGERLAKSVQDSGFHGHLRGSGPRL